MSNLAEQRARLEQVAPRDVPEAERLIRFLPDSVMVHQAGRIVFANNAAARLMRAGTADELIGRDILSFVPPEERSQVRQETRGWLAERVGSAPLRHKSLGFDGSAIDVETTALALDWNGREAVLLVSRDLSERYRAETVLNESEERYRRLIEVLPDAVYIHDGSRILFVNPAGVREFGAKEAAEIVGRSPLEFCHPEERGQIGSGVRQMIATGRSTPDLRRRRRMRIDGSQYLADVAVQAMTWQGRPAVLVAVRDVTAEVNAAAELRDSEERYRRLVDLLPDAIYIHDGERILFVNPAGVTMFGARDETDIIGRAPAEFLHPSNRDSLAGRARDLIAGKLSTEFIRRRRLRVDGTEYLADVAALQLNWKGKPAVLAVVRDVTDQVRAAEELRRSNAELEQFAYVASHDLQEPLRTVSSYCQLLEKRYKEKLDKNAADYIEFAVSGAKRMQLLINDLLQYSRVGTRGKPFRPTELNQVFADVVSSLDRAISESGATVTRGELPVVPGDAVQLGQLFQNLIGNAIKFRGPHAPEIEVGAAEIEGETVFSVKDNGIGIEAQHADRIFQIFQRLHEREKYSGTGIGLAVCKKIVERHGGRIWVESAPGQGSAFLFTLPGRPA
jgi:PAS domain S-box-containing protein